MSRKFPVRKSFSHRCLWTEHSIPPILHPAPLFQFFFHLHGLEICKTAIICGFWLHKSTDMYIEMPFSAMASQIWPLNTGLTVISKLSFISFCHWKLFWKFNYRGRRNIIIHWYQKASLLLMAKTWKIFWDFNVHRLKGNWREFSCRNLTTVPVVIKNIKKI